MPKKSSISCLLCGCGLLLLSACASNPSDRSAQQQQKKPRIEINLGENFKNYNKQESKAWLAEALAKLSCADHYPILSFENEYCATNTALRIWADVKKEEFAESSTLDDMLAVKRAGFLREYLWVYLRREYWFKPDDLLLDKFDKWRARHLKSHIPNTQIDVEARTAQPPINPHFEKSSFNSGYPEHIGKFEYQSEGRYFPTQYGKSVRYQIGSEIGNLNHADIYIYDIPPKQRVSDRKKLTLSISSQVKAEIIHVAESGGYQNFRTLQEGSIELPGENTMCSKGVYGVSINNLPHFSTLYLCLYKNKVFKIRISYPNNQHYANSNHFQDFVLEAFEKLKPLM